MRRSELERIIRLTLQHTCGVTRFQPDEVASLAAQLVGAASIEGIAEAIAKHASRRLGDNVFDLREGPWRTEICAMLRGFVALRSALNDTAAAGS